MPFVGSTLVTGEKREVVSFSFLAMSCLFACGLLRCEKPKKNAPSLFSKMVPREGALAGKTLYLTAYLRYLLSFPTLFWGVYMYHPSIHPSLSISLFGCARVCRCDLLVCNDKKKKQIDKHGWD